jgi:hypothetical protein
MIKMNYTIDVPEEIVDFFDSLLKILDLGFNSSENMLKHILLEGLEHRLEHLAQNQSLDQHSKYHKILDEEKEKCFIN